MKTKFLYIFIGLVAVPFGMYANSNNGFNEVAAHDTVGVFAEKLPQVDIISIDGQLSIKSDEVMSSMEVYSSIGGLLYRSDVNSSDVKISNIAKTVIVIRIKFKNGKSSVYKIKMQ
ncbi:MAG: hypothetical protein LBT04_05140 [Prevotellaceae bacterium]|jgi:hypothetical protein|nr:hypothetical protein [Prevotellaceae bacterium]